MTASIQTYYPYGMLMPKRYKEWNSGGCVTTVQNVWVTLSNDSLALEYDPNTPRWYVVSLDNKIFNAEFSKIDEYGQPLPEGEDSTITITGMVLTGDGACASITNGIEASTTYSARLNITDLNREGSVEVDVVQIEDGGAVERLLSSQTVTGTGLMDIDFTTETNDSVRVKIVLSEDMGDRDTAYVSLKLDKFSHPITLTHYYQALQPRLVTTCGEVKDLYRFGHNGQEKTNELAGVGNHNTALHWEYDTRTAFRWNRDPVMIASQSPYAVFNGNPILNTDRLGNVGEPVVSGNTLTIYSNIVFYGGAATPQLANQAAKNIQTQWTNANGTVTFQGKEYTNVNFVVTAKAVSEQKAQNMAAANKGDNYDPRLNFARIESRNDVPKNTANRVAGEVPGGDNSMFLLAEDIRPEGTSQAHEMGHGFGLGIHVNEGERFMGVPRIMTTRNTLVDKDYSVDGKDGGMLNINCREVTQADISGMKFNKYEEGIGGGIKVGNSSNVLFNSKGKPVGATAPEGVRTVQPK